MEILDNFNFAVPSWGSVLTVSIVSFCYVFCKSLQQRYVIYNLYKRVPLISMTLALCEAISLSLVVNYSFWLFIPIGISGATGCLIAMRLDNYLKDKYKRREHE